MPSNGHRGLHMKPQEHTITFLTIPVLKATIYSADTGEVTWYCNVQHNGVTYREVPVVRLQIQAGFEMNVTPKYSGLVPCLEPIPEFRSYFNRLLANLALQNPEVNEMLKEGIRVYQERLRNYDATVAIVRQAKAAVRNLRPDNLIAIPIARQILSALSEIPGCDIGFTVAD